MQVSNEVAWQDWQASNTDPYGGEVIRYAEAWADLMEARMATGAELEDIAKTTSCVGRVRFPDRAPSKGSRLISG